jgi:hypothetical protein
MPDSIAIKPVENYSRMSVGEVITRALAAANGCEGNPYFPKPPVKPVDLRAAAARLQALQAETLEGTRKIFAERDKQLVVVINMMKLLGRYVEITADGDMEKFRSSNFEPAPPNKKPQAQLSENIWSLDWGPNSGTAVIRLRAVPDAVSYEIRYGPMSEDREKWKSKGAGRIKTPITIGNLTPMTMYGFQVRSLGKNGEYSDWTDPVTLIIT